MKNRVYRVLALALLLALVVGALPAMAAAKKPKLVAQTFYAGTDDVWLTLNNWVYDGTMELVSVKSSKSSVLKVLDSDELLVTPKKAGTATITVTYRLNGKKYTTSAKFTVKKYPNAIKSLTFNGKKVNLKKPEYMVGYEYLDFDVTKFKINLKPASGWSISKIKAYTSTEEDGRNPKTITVKNNKQFKVSRDDCAFVTYALKDKKGSKFNYTISILRVGE